MEQLIEKLLSQLTLEEKIGMIHGATLFRTAPVERLEIPGLSMSDGPMGVRGEYPDSEWRYLNRTDDFVTYLPCNSAVASTWNRALAEASGSVLGEEARGRGKDVILAPGINIKRSPLCGRNFEYMSEDPFLVEEMVVPMVQGIQRHDAAACVKHFAVNSQETYRLSVDTQVDAQTLNEIYFPGFRAAVEKGGLLSIMGAYNKLQGKPCCTSSPLLNDVLRKDWGFDGVVISDWGGVHDTTEAAQSALDIEMDVTYDFDNHYMARPLLEKVQNGEISQDLIDEKIRNILRLMLRLKMIGPERENRSSGAYNTPEHHSAARAVAEESIILLKNEENILPLDPRVKKVAVIGANAVTMHSFGGGSAEIKALYEITPLMGIKKLLGGNAKVSYAPGYHVPDNGGRSEISWQADSTKQQPGWVPNLETPPEIRSAYLEEALKLAKDSEAVIFVGGLDHNYDVEGLDRKDLKLPYGQDEVIAELLKVRPDMTVVLYAGSPVEMPWLADCKSLVWSYYAGMEGGSALADVLFGRVNPSGKLAETFLRTLDQCSAANFGRTDLVCHDEGVMVGYRHYDTVHTDVNFCFGHGLSYTNFEYADLCCDGTEVSLTVKNTGSRPGKEAVQLYVATDGCGRPSHQLRGFEKISLQPGEKKTVKFTLTDRDFAVYNVDKKAFVPVGGEYRLEIGASSRDIRLSTVFAKE